ncbi:hypothetical protein PTI98_008185 [Pleurotus ostreatus]|nr:hypothetical protein PTI98_008185 [Pleurotus ostreatus]
MEVPLHMTNSGKGNGGLVNMLTTPWDGAPVEEAVLRSIFIKRTNFGTYGALFKHCLKFPMLMDMLQNPNYDFTSEAHTKVWGGREVGRMTLGKVLDELEAELAAEEAKVVAEKAKKAKEAKKKSAAKKATNFCLQGLWMVLSVLFLLGLLPCAAAAPLEDPFPDIRFADFAKVIKLTFGENISLATVLMLLFSITTNTDILNLHGQQRAVSSNNQVVTSWMAAFVRAIKDKLQVDVSDVPGDSDDDDAGAGNVDSDSGSSEDNMDASDNNSNSGSDEDMDSSGSSSSGSSDTSVNAETVFDTLFLASDNHKSCSAKGQTTILGKKIDSLCHSLDLYTHNDKRQLRRKLLPISTSSIQPIIIITPPVMGCSTAGCHGHGLTQYLRERDISKVTLLHGIGKQVWVDRIVSKAVMNANYSFHASTAAITEFWNYSFVQPSGASFTLTHRQVWKAFVLESIRLLAGFSNSTMIFMDNLKISELVAAAYLYLGDGGIIRSAVGHSCDECCHAFKDVADVIPNQDDNPAALAGHDENRDVPEYAGPAVAAAVADAEAMDVDNVPANDAPEPAGGVALHTNADIRMIVIDGIVMGPRHCAIAGCEAGLLNAQTGVFCKEHEEEMEGCCWMKNCNKNKVGLTQACEDHQEQWRTFRGRYANSSLLGVQRMLRRAQEERQEWLPVGGRAEAPEHDDLAEQEAEQVSGSKYNNYFSAPRFYCVETICAPCGVVIAWRKFAKSEGVAKILQLLEDVYPDPASRPIYIAIDKGCALLKHIVRQEHWPAWEPTTRIIVDSYHYINHRVTDHLCRTWCNPAPLNGDAPNLVVVDEDKQGNSYYKRAFNTQACEQLNAWLGGFQTVLNRMTVSNFDFTMHVLLFLHTQRVIARQEERNIKKAAGIEEVVESEESDDEDMIEY